MKGSKLPKAGGALVRLVPPYRRCAGVSACLYKGPSTEGRATCDRSLCAAHAIQVSSNRHDCFQCFYGKAESARCNPIFLLDC